ncbi:MAG: hypothetical protein LBU19_03980 [Treponema sp.]|jgi:hypothetical protein|nr:hypothetical protein [Treponema sp.]
MKRGVRLSMVLCCCFVSAVLFSGFFIASHEDHDCPGEGCSLCLLVRGALNFSRQLRQAPACPLFPPGLLLISPFIAGFFAFYAVPASAVRLKVRINR